MPASSAEAAAKRSSAGREGLPDGFAAGCHVLWLGLATPAAKRLIGELRRAGASVDAVDPDHAWPALLPAARRHPPDVVMLDLADARTAAIVRKLRQAAAMGQRPEVGPVLALAREQHLRPPVLTAVADDFVLPPFRTSEVLTRLALLRQQGGRASDRVVRISELEVDVAERQVRLNGEDLALTPRELDLLTYLAVHRGQAFSRKTLLEHVWGRAYEGGPRTVDIHVRRLREKLPPPHDDCIETIRHVGYRLREPRRIVPSPSAEEEGI